MALLTAELTSVDCQSAIPDLLTPVPGSAEAQSLTDFKKRYFATLEDNANFTVDAISEIPGLEVVVPQGAMYAMVRTNSTPHQKQSILH